MEKPLGKRALRGLGNPLVKRGSGVKGGHEFKFDGFLVDAISLRELRLPTDGGGLIGVRGEHCSQIGS